MSIRRNIGDVLIKKMNAGFVQEQLWVRIPDLNTFKAHGFGYQSESEDYNICLLSCGDPLCKEYGNIEEVDSNLKHLGWVYHVSECQLEDLV